jgi:peptidoglycan/xylan/chitin deacetylase (PgdA/CDA1 family)
VRAVARRSGPALALVARGLDRAVRLRSSCVGLAVTYHGVAVRAGDPAREILPALGLRDFDAQLGLLNARYDLVMASDLPDAVARRTRGAPLPLAITFDDDLESHGQLAAPLLRRHGIHATFFVSDASRAGPPPLWWERLQRAAERDLLADLPIPGLGDASTAVREAGWGVIASAMVAATPHEREVVSSYLAERLGDEPPYAHLGADGVVALARDGHEIGFHTRRHDPLPTLDDDALHHAMRDGVDELSALAGRPITSIAYPHGAWDARVPSAARAAGFRVGFTTAGAAWRHGDDPLLVPRLEAGAPSPGWFAVRLSRAASLRRG